MGRGRKAGWRAGLGVVACVVLLSHAAAPAGARAPDPGWQRQAEFAAAAREFAVPQAILLAVAYNLTRWEVHLGQQSADGGYGPMDLIAARQGAGNDPAAPVSATDTLDSKGNSHRAHDGTESAAASAHRATGDPQPGSPVDTAARALQLSAGRLESDPAQNIRAGAMLLARYAKEAFAGRTPIGLADWYPAVLRFAGSPTAAGGQAFADDVFDTLRHGARATTSDGQTLVLAGDRRVAAGGSRSAGGPEPECPPGLDCRFVPAAYDWSTSDHRDPNNYGNYDPADRPRDGNPIRYIVIHDTEGIPGAVSPYDQAIRAFQDPARLASAHYVIRSSDGQITQLVPTKDVAWHTGNWTLNAESIGIEHEGYAAQGGSWYTERMYESSARLVRYLAARYHIPLDRKHILGHEDIPRDVAGPQFANAHWDPGPYWDWAHYLDLLGAPVLPSEQSTREVVTIRPSYPGNQPPLQDCAAGPCTPLPPHGSNAVYLHTAPSADSPLITDAVVHPDGAPGTTAVSDWSDKAVTGRSYVVAGHSGDWTAIFYGGQRAWFDNPGGSVAVPAAATVATPRTRLAAVALYGRAFPAPSAYPPEIAFDPDWQPSTVPWIVPAGQSYVVVGEFGGANYYARFDPAGAPANHTVITGPPDYLLLSYNHRYVFARAADLTLN